MALCLMTIGFVGCRHRTVIPSFPPPQTPMKVIDAPPNAKAPLVDTPQVKMPPIPIAAAAATPQRERKHPAKTTVAPPEPEPASPATSVTPATPRPDANSLGALTTGTTADPQTKQEATDLIAAIEKRLKALPSQMDDAQKAQINKAKNFWRDAQEALKSGDAEGAMTLATKAKLLLDDQQQ